MIERLIIAAALLALFVVALALARRWFEARNARIEANLRAEVEPGSADAPRIVYFTTRSCVVCRAQQEPAMFAVEERVPDLVLERHDAVIERELADRFGVVSVPTTAVYDRRGELVTINRGFAPAAVLLAQIEGREPAFEGGAEMASEEVVA